MKIDAKSNSKNLRKEDVPQPFIAIPVFPSRVHRHSAIYVRADRGITNAVELNWGQSIAFKGLTVVCTPAQHGSGRTPFEWQPAQSPATAR